MEFARGGIVVSEGTQSFIIRGCDYIVTRAYSAKFVKEVLDRLNEDGVE